MGVTKKTPADAQVQHARVNGQPGIVIFVAGKAVTVLTLDVIDGRIVTCYAIRNPEKLAASNRTWPITRRNRCRRITWRRAAW